MEDFSIKIYNTFCEMVKENHKVNVEYNGYVSYPKNKCDFSVMALVNGKPLTMDFNMSNTFGEVMDIVKVHMLSIPRLLED